MVPPWNRVAPALAARLPAIGFTALSTYQVRRSAAGLGVAQVNCHLDILQWRPQRRFLGTAAAVARSEEHTSELQSLMRISYAVFFLQNKKNKKQQHHHT